MTQKKKRELSTSSYKLKAWKAFSRYIRVRDCLLTTGKPDHGICCTCGKAVEYKYSQAGHFISGRRNAVLFSEKGVHLQCYGCNIGRGGALHEYWLFMEEKYGRPVIDQLIRESKETVKYTKQDYQDIAKEYHDKIEELLDGQKQIKPF